MPATTAPHPVSSRLPGLLAALGAVSIWGGWVPVTRFAVVGHVGPEDLAAVRYGVSALLLWPILVFRRAEVPWRRWPLLLALVVGAGVPYQLLFAHGVQMINSGQAAAMGPGAVNLLVALLAVSLLGERLRRGQVIGLCTTLAGIAAVVAHGSLGHGAPIVGFLLILAAATAWAVFTTVSRVLRLPPILNAATVACINGVLYVPAYLAAGGMARLAAIPAPELWLQVGYQGVLTAIVALILFAYAVERLGAAAAAGVMPLSPVLAPIFGWLLLKDRVDAMTAVGLAAVAAGVLIANRSASASLSRG
jgi:drug/metabolite transporter (DMT)-like permease